MNPRQQEAAALLCAFAAAQGFQPTVEFGGDKAVIDIIVRIGGTPLDVIGRIPIYPEEISADDRAEIATKILGRALVLSLTAASLGRASR